MKNTAGKTSCNVNILVNVAMKQEAEPFLQLAQIVEEFQINKMAKAWLLDYESKRFFLVQSSVGLVNAAQSVSKMIDNHPITHVFSAGTAGGMGEKIQVGDIICGTKYTYNGADARIFGYELGQVPHMPVEYLADEKMLDLAKKTIDQERVFFGQIISGDSFVTAHNIGSKRVDYPRCLATDMETTAIAQTCYLNDIAFISIRCVSDLCGPTADEDFYLELDKVTLRSAESVVAMIAEM